MSDNTTFDNNVSSTDSNNNPVYPYLSLVVQFFMTLSLLIIAILRFINTRSQLRLNKIKDEYYANKSKKKWKNIEIA